VKVGNKENKARNDNKLDMVFSLEKSAPFIIEKPRQQNPAMR
jgi:hypothetical protein